MICPIQEDHTLLRFLNDSNRTMYAFEMLPAPQIEEISETTDTSPGTSGIPSNNATSSGTAPNNIVSSSSQFSTASSPITADSCDSSTSVTNVVSSSGGHLKRPTEITSTTASVETLVDEQSQLNNSTEVPNQGWSSESDFKCAIDFQHNPLTAPDSTSNIAETPNSEVSSTNENLEAGLIAQAASQSEPQFTHRSLRERLWAFYRFLPRY